MISSSTIIPSSSTISSYTVDISETTTITSSQNHHHHRSSTTSSLSSLPTTTTTTTLSTATSSQSTIVSSNEVDETPPSQQPDIDFTVPELEKRYHVQYIKPSKIHVQSLHEDDLLYESKKIDSPNYLGSENLQEYQHITGHFRNKSNKIWDPHPQYEIDAFDRHMHLILYHDNNFIPKDLKVSVIAFYLILFFKLICIKMGHSRKNR